MTARVMRATHDGELKIGDAIISCAVLEDGTRLLSQSGFLRALGRSARPSGQARLKVGFEQVPAFLRAKSLKSYVTPELLDSTKPIHFVPTHGGRAAIGYKADLLPQICDIFLSARKDKALTPVQIRLADQCEILMRGLAHVGITALVDEATGYQADRARDELEKILSAFIAKEYQKWIKTFPDEFYEEMFRLKGWRYDPLSVKRPSLVGKYTNDLVYERLAPGVLEELKASNPKNPKGRRRHLHHQWLTEDIGHPRLREHLSGVIALMKISRTWEDFRRHLSRVYKKHPKIGQNLQLPHIN